MAAYTSIHDVPHQTYSLIMADPPWRFATYSAKGGAKGPQYACMDLDSLKALPVSDLAARDCVLWLWATNPMLPQAIETMAAWGFDFRTAGTWIKTTASGKIRMGTGYWLRSTSEPFLIGVRGKARPASRSIRSGFLAQAGRHSEKPAAAFDFARAMAPQGCAIELFARSAREGWDAMGDELEASI